MLNVWDKITVTNKIDAIQGRLDFHICVNYTIWYDYNKDTISGLTLFPPTLGDIPGDVKP